MKKLFLLDAFALIYRAHFAFSQSPRITSYGMNTSAIFGFLNTLLEVINKEKPTHIAVCFDTPETTERHTDFAEYKANRQAMPEDLRIAIPYIYELLRAMNVAVVESPGYEADDVIGTLAKMAEKEGYTTYCMTPDKDYGQLVSENIFIYKPARMGNGVEIQGVNEILAKWEIENPLQVIDILGLWGDSVDNIPGIPGIGEKTAKLLIKEYGSMENIIANADKLKGKMQENVLNFSAQGLLSKKLATIILDVPVSIDEAYYTTKAPNRELLEPLLTKLEFRTLGKRIFGEALTTTAPAAVKAAPMDLFSQSADAAPVFSTPKIETDENDTPVFTQNISNTNHTYHKVDTEAAINELIEKLSTSKELCFDTETTGIDAITAELVGLSFSINKGEAWYVPVSEVRTEAEARVNKFKGLLENPNSTKIGQNIKYDIAVLYNYGIKVQGPLWDTMLAHYLIDADSRHNMDVLANNYLNYTPVSISELIGKKGKSQGSMRDVDVDIVKEYAGEDADITLQLKEIFAPKIKEINAEKLLLEVETPLIYVLADIERQGVRIDTEGLKTYSIQLGIEIAEAEKQVYEKAGLKFNLASPKQLGEVLFDHLKLMDKPPKTKTGQYKTDEDVLLSLASKSDVVQNILDFRGLQKLKSTYVDALPTMVNATTGRVHSSFNQAIASTGRLSSQNPNLQNIPIKTERGREVRKAFIPRNDDYTLLSADYSQIELRLIAHIAQDEAMIQAFAEGIDIHTATASRVYGVAINEVDSTMRRNAKSVNFGIIYGQSAFGLSQNLGIPRKEAAEIIEQYFEAYTGIKKYMADVITSAKANGYVETLLGRRRYLKDINSANASVRGFAERNAINAPIQGSAADLIKVAMINIHKALNAQKLLSKMTLQVHDELVFDVYKPELELVRGIVIHEMQNAIPNLSVPIIVETGAGKNWLEAH